MIRAVIWDLDGTLIKFKVNSIKARRKAIQILKNNGVPRDLLYKNKPIIENIEIARKIFTEKNYSQHKITEILKLVNQAVIEVEYEAAIKAELTYGIDEVLEFVKKKNLHQAIFTYNTYKNALISIQKVKIESYFDIIAGRDTISNLKPHPDHLKYVCDKINVSPKNVLVIGDTARDIEAAVNVGAFSIALNTKIPLYLKKGGFQKADKIIQECEIPDILIKTIEEFL
jgi:HAD superfamily hydrolase (TIGR01549 family)